MPDTSVRLVVTYDAWIDGELCAKKCAYLARAGGTETRKCTAFDVYLQRADTGRHWRCGDCCDAEQERAAEAGRDK